VQHLRKVVDADIAGLSAPWLFSSRTRSLVRLKGSPKSSNQANVKLGIGLRIVDRLLDFSGAMPAPRASMPYGSRTYRRQLNDLTEICGSVGQSIAAGVRFGYPL
jgi:hypothetical protein